jgi:hypothetical protein
VAAFEREREREKERETEKEVRMPQHSTGHALPIGAYLDVIVIMMYITHVNPIDNKSLHTSTVSTAVPSASAGSGTH